MTSHPGERHDDVAPSSHVRFARLLVSPSRESFLRCSPPHRASSAPFSAFLTGRKAQIGTRGFSLPSSLALFLVCVHSHMHLIIAEASTAKPYASRRGMLERGDVV